MPGSVFRKLGYFALFLAVFGFGGTYVVGGAMVAPAMRPVPLPKTGLPFEVAAIDRPDGRQIAGWFAAGSARKPGVLLLHSIRSNRAEMMGRARFLFDAGYTVLLIDLQAHGETPGDFISFGYRESVDAKAALAYLRSRVATQKVGVIGVSLGGASALLGATPIDADAVVLESVYSTIEHAIENRLTARFGALGDLAAPLFTWQIEPRLGMPLEHLSPLQAIANLNAPVLIIAGTDDRHTLSAESRRLFAAARTPKRLWLVDGAKHENLHAYAGQEYEERILGFLAAHLDQERPSKQR